jgi:hypothetical protein
MGAVTKIEGCHHTFNPWWPICRTENLAAQRSEKAENASAAYPAKNAKLAALKLTAPGNLDDPDMARRSPSRASHKAAVPDAVKMSRGDPVGPCAFQHRASVFWIVSCTCFLLGLAASCSFCRRELSSLRKISGALYRDTL